jgi:hypothetical protein
MSSMQENSVEKLPGDKTMAHAARLACEQDKPIMLDYWSLSCQGKVLVGVKDDGEKLLVKSEDEYTSPIGRMYKVEEDYLVITENSIYITVAGIETRKIS